MKPAKSPVSPAKTSPPLPKKGALFFFISKNSSESALQTLLQAREEELSKAQAEVKGKSAATDKNTHSVEHTPGWAFSSSQNCGESCRPRRKPPTSVSRLSDQRPEDPSSTFDFWFPPSPETQAEFDQAVAALTRKGESETADGESSSGPKAAFVLPPRGPLWLTWSRSVPPPQS